MSLYDSRGNALISVETARNDDRGRDDVLVTLTITWDGLPDYHAAAAFASEVQQLARKHLGSLRHRHQPTKQNPPSL